MKSIFKRSIGCVALIKVLLFGVKKRGLILEQAMQLLQHRLTSSKEYGRFLDLTKCHKRVTPGQHSSLWIVSSFDPTTATDAQEALVSVSGPTFLIPGLYLIEYEKEANSNRQHIILLFLILVLFLASNIKATDF